MHVKSIVTITTDLTVASEKGESVGVLQICGGANRPGWTEVLIVDRQAFPHSLMSFRLLWNLAARGLSAHIRASQWTHRLKRHKTSGIVGYSRRVNSSQWILRRLRNAFDRYGRKAIVLSATGVYNATKDGKSSPFDWSQCNINDDTLQDLTGEMGEMESLKMATIVCSVCKKRLIIDKAQSGTVYCSCANNKAIVDPKTGWHPFLEDKDIIIWRKEQEGGGGLFAYKVYGRYSEVTAEDFLAMHIDTKYWQSWDSSALSVRTLDNKYDHLGGQCVIHWEMLWPRFFTNRDYVYLRRYAYLSDTSNRVNRNGEESKSTRFVESSNSDTNRGIRNNEKMIVITSRSCDHPNVPENSSAYRVKKYWSNLVISPFIASDKPGIEFSLTYFDDPGANIPSSLQAWVAGQGMPDFLARMRKAAAVYKKVMKNNANSNHTVLKPHSEVQIPSTQPDVLVNLAAKCEDTVKTANDKQYDNSTEEFLNLINGKSSNVEENSKKVSENVPEEAVQYTTFADANLINPAKEDVEAAKQTAEEIKSNVEQNQLENHILDEQNVESLPEEPKMDFVSNKHAKEAPPSQNQESVASENQEKPSNQTQNNNYNYWHFWPLYYFA
ncbi:uncharacterized protein LOC143914127 [Arctopsyche grandis]|uniref:uncharacterized protein LOC143914127 n=1 Tax=Arctopsyche grandis TaxID=121162 RepID=UPI00406D7BB7